MFKTIIILFYSIGLLNGLNYCGDWTQYKDSKCFKVLREEGTESEAHQKCNEFGQDSTLITIKDKDEQEFLNNFLKQYQDISVSAWIGLTNNGTEFNWIDGTKVNYTNWSQYSSARDMLGQDKQCVRMPLFEGILGKWYKSVCYYKSLIVCQKKLDLNLFSLESLIENLTDIIDKQRDKIQTLEEKLENKTKNFENINKELQSKLEALRCSANEQKNELDTLKFNSTPIGFLYSQLPNQSSPEQLWPNMRWTEVTHQYSGLFFRAEGAGSEPFGQIQQDTQLIVAEGCDINTSHRDKDNSTGFAGSQLSCMATSGEVRPKNTAIRIWKRIQ